MLTDIEEVVGAGPLSNKYDNKTVDVGVYNKLVPCFRTLIQHLDNCELSQGYNCQEDSKPGLLSTYIRKPASCSYGKVELLKYYRKAVETGDMVGNKQFRYWLQSKSMRSASGVLVITLVMKPDRNSCPMDCAFCPTQPGITKSYLLDEPAVHRGFENDWDAYRQFNCRADTYDAMGHDISKVEIIIEGGTFGSYDKQYSEEFIRDIYYAANTYQSIKRSRLSLAQEIINNESADTRIIGLTIETRPDWINDREILRFRYLSVTRVQLGIQHINDDILNGVDRQCTTEQTERGISLLMNNGFKVDGHFMPDLPGSDPITDMNMFVWLFSDDNETMQCDQYKIYPTMVTNHTKIKIWYEQGRYLPYADEDEGRHMANLLQWILTHAPYHVRLNRIVRDIPVKDIVGGTKTVHWRQLLQDKIKKENLVMTDIRGREIKTGITDGNFKFWLSKYRSSDGTEYFISVENDNRTKLYGFVRLRLNDNFDKVLFPVLNNSAFVRELHVYGRMVKQGNKGGDSLWQHAGLGKVLLYLAEYISVLNNYKKLSIISGTGVRAYYSKLDYKLIDTYMVKTLYVPSIQYPDKWQDMIDQFMLDYTLVKDC